MSCPRTSTMCCPTVESVFGAFNSWNRSVDLNTRAFEPAISSEKYKPHIALTLSRIFSSNAFATASCSTRHCVSGICPSLCYTVTLLGSRSDGRRLRAYHYFEHHFVRQVLPTDDAGEREPNCETMEYRQRLSGVTATTRKGSYLGYDNNIQSHPTNLYSTLNIRPVLPNPSCISSIMSSKPCWSQMARSPRMNAGSAETNPLWPLSPGTGSMVIAASSAPGAVSKWYQQGMGMARSAHGLAAHCHIRLKAQSKRDGTMTHHEWQNAMRTCAEGPPVVSVRPAS